MNVLYEAITSLHRQVDERIADDATTPCLLSFDRARAVLDALLVQPEQEPVAWISKHGVVYPLDAKDEVHPINDLQPLYAIPPRREWVGLTDEEMDGLTDSPGFFRGVRWAEAKLKEKNSA